MCGSCRTGRRGEACGGGHFPGVVGLWETRGFLRPDGEERRRTTTAPWVTPGCPRVPTSIVERGSTVPADLGPGSIDQAHSDEEWVGIEETALAAEILAEAAFALAGDQ